MKKILIPVIICLMLAMGELYSLVNDDSPKYVVCLFAWFGGIWFWHIALTLWKEYQDGKA